MLVTGGSGYLGSRIVGPARTDWEVTATYLTRRMVTRGVVWQRLDLRDESAVMA